MRIGSDVDLIEETDEGIANLKPFSPVRQAHCQGMQKGGNLMEVAR